VFAVIALVLVLAGVAVEFLGVSKIIGVLVTSADTVVFEASRVIDLGLAAHLGYGPSVRRVVPDGAAVLYSSTADPSVPVAVDTCVRAVAWHVADDDQPWPHSWPFEHLAG
jgi:hypothetical protein